MSRWRPRPLLQSALRPLAAGVLILLLMSVAWERPAADYELPDTPANRERGVVGCTQTSTGIECPGDGGEFSGGFGGGCALPVDDETYLPPHYDSQVAQNPDNCSSPRRMENGDILWFRPDHEFSPPDSYCRPIEQRRLDALIQSERENELYASAALRNEMGNNWSDAGISAYNNGEWGEALQYMRIAESYMPNNENIQNNIAITLTKAREEAKGYFSSLRTVLLIKSVSPKLLLFHPDPYVRMEAQKQLVKESIKKIAEASAIFIVNEHLNQGKLEPFKWETQQELEERKRIAAQHARWVEELKLQAFKEAHEKAMSLQSADLSDEKLIAIENGLAMRQLIELSYSGFQ